MVPVEKVKDIIARYDLLEKELVCIPVGWWLTDKEKEYIVESIINYFNIWT